MLVKIHDVTSAAHPLPVWGGVFITCTLNFLKSNSSVFLVKGTFQSFSEIAAHFQSPFFISPFSFIRLSRIGLSLLSTLFFRVSNFSSKLILLRTNYISSRIG